MSEKTFPEMKPEEKEAHRQKIKKDNEELKKEEEDALEGINQLWKDEHGNPFATIIIKNCDRNHLENWGINSRHFRNFITKKIFDKKRKVPSSQEIKTLQDIFSARAQFEGKQYNTFLRCAKINDEVYIDLCRPDWKVLKITKDEIKLVEENNIKLKRFNHMKELRYDRDANEEDLNLIFKYLSIQKPSERLLVKVDCILQAISDIPRVIDIFHGSPGSTKTSAMKFKRKILDPSSMDTLSLSKDKTELIQKMSHHYICNFDNVRKISNDFSDIFCRAVTGDAFSKRELYTDDEDVIYKIKRKLMFNGINVVGEEPDFLDRSVTYELTKIPKAQRKKESVLLAEFEKDQPKITGAIFKILQKSLSKVNLINIKELPRMADYCFWGEAVSQILGEKEKVFTLTYFEKIGALSREVLEANPVGLCLLEYLKENSFEGTATELLEILEKKAEELKINTKNNYFPSAPNSLTRRINEIKANLEEEGFKVDYDTTGKKRIIKIYKKSIVESVDIVERGSTASVKEVNDIVNDKEEEESDTVEEPNMSTIGTIDYDISKKGKNEGLSREKQDNVNGINDKDSISPEILDQFTLEEKKIIKEQNLTPEDIETLIKARQEDSKK